LLENMDEQSIAIFDIIECEPCDKQKPSAKDNSNRKFRFHRFCL
jgi:hypothetical protein